MITAWRQFERSGFFFLFGGDKILFGAYMVFDESGVMKWALCSGSSARRWIHDADAWHEPDEEYLKELRQIPSFMKSDEDYSFSLEIIRS